MGAGEVYSRQAKLKPALCQVDCEYHYRSINLISNVQDLDQVHFGVMGLYKSHARTSSSQLSVVSLDLTFQLHLPAELLAVLFSH